MTVRPIGLTGVQLSIVLFLAEPHPFPPTLKEIGAAVGLSSNSSVSNQINNLTRAKVLAARPKRTARSIALAAEVKVVDGLPVWDLPEPVQGCEEDLRVSLNWDHSRRSPS